MCSLHSGLPSITAKQRPSNSPGCRRESTPLQFEQTIDKNSDLEVVAFTENENEAEEQ